MTTTSTTSSTTYELRVACHLDDHWAGTLGDLTLTRLDDGSTSLTGRVVDQAQLHGVLARVRDLGVPLLTLRALDGPAPSAATSPPRSERSTLARDLRTERLILRPGTPVDAEATWAYRRLETVSEWLTEIPTDLLAYRAAFTDPHRLATTVIVEHDGAVIGDFTLRIENAWAQVEVADEARGRQAELGWVLDPARTGHGYATEAVRGLLDHCFTELGVRRVVASCFLPNTTSWRLMERVGMRREGHAVAESLHRSGQWLDTLTYALLVSEWTASEFMVAPPGSAQKGDDESTACP